MNPIFYISNVVCATEFFNELKDSIKSSDQITFHARTISEAILQIAKHPSSSIKIVISDDWINDFTNKTPHTLNDFIYIKEKLSFFISGMSGTKWCFLIDAQYYDGNLSEFEKYCEDNKILFLDAGKSCALDEFIKFIKN